MHGENDDLGASPCTLQVEEAQNTKDIYMYIICKTFDVHFTNVILADLISKATLNSLMT